MITVHLYFKKEVDNIVKEEMEGSFAIDDLV
jgi:hypothetical protein